MGCVHTHQRILAIERWGNSNHVLYIVNKTRENNQKAGKNNQTLSQTPTLRPKQDKI
jgi:hypothetical protein